MTLSEKQQIFSKMLGEFLVWIYLQKGYGVAIEWAKRTLEQQEEMVSIGASKTIDSMHLKKLAIDLSLFINGEYVKDGNKYRHLGEKWEAMGKSYGVDARWGGRLGVDPSDYSKRIGWDANHFELHD